MSELIPFYFYFIIIVINLIYVFILAEENSISIITQKENLHKLEFNCIMDKMENNILDLHSSIEDCKLIADVMYVDFILVYY